MMKSKVYEMMAKRGIKTRKRLAKLVGIHQTHIGKIVDGKPITSTNLVATVRTVRTGTVAATNGPTANVSASMWRLYPSFIPASVAEPWCCIWTSTGECFPARSAAPCGLFRP